MPASAAVDPEDRVLLRRVGEDLRTADLQGADLHVADLEGAKLEGAQLRWADLRRARGLTREQLMLAADPERARISVEEAARLGIAVAAEWAPPARSDGSPDVADGTDSDRR